MEDHKCPDCGKNFDSAEALNQHKEAKHTTEIKAEEQKNNARSFNFDKTKAVLYALILIAGVAAAYAIMSSLSTGPRIGSVGSTHEHVDFKIYIEGKPIDFSQQKYQVAAQYVHVEGGVGGVVHKHATGVTFRDFLKTVNMDMESKCFKSDNNKNYCDENGETLKFYLNGKLNDKFESYELRDLDKVLISYGNETEDEIRQQLAGITDLAKIESGKQGVPKRLG
ncbi:MAG: C2H2-type zinc finger protein [Candidatus Aenigmarchaeota archaeon]|nr:C2H2-type zinc finger protein [Candidatus Aenigmarchaeota archaeon]